MPGLLDIAPPELLTEVLDIRGVQLEIRGLSEREWVRLLHRFPQLRKRSAEAEPASVESGDDQALANLDVLAPVIAAGLGKIADNETEAEIGKRLTFAEQMTVFNAVIRLTVGPPSPLPKAPAAAGEESASQPTATPTPPSP